MNINNNYHPIADVEKKLKSLHAFFISALIELQNLVAANNGDKITHTYIEKLCSIVNALLIPSRSKSSGHLIAFGLTANIEKASHHLIHCFGPDAKIFSHVTRNVSINRLEKLLDLTVEHSSVILFDAWGLEHFDLRIDSQQFAGEALLENLKPGIVDAGRALYRAFAEACKVNTLSMTSMLPKSVSGATELIEMKHISTWHRKNLLMFKGKEKINIDGRYQIVDEMLYKDGSNSSSSSSSSSDGVTVEL